MTADEFSRELRSLAPSVEELRKLGMTPDGIERYREGYFCSRVSTSDTEDLLLDLCSNFDVSTVGVGTIAFCQLREFDSDYWQVGECESDPVVVPKLGGLVSIRDHENLKRQCAVCAKNSEGFLAALLEAEKFLSQCPFYPEKRAQGQQRFVVLDRCVLLAGGKEFRKFYRGVLGINEPRIWRFLSQPMTLDNIKRLLRK
jgi:hypothetical protein